MGNLQKRPTCACCGQLYGKRDTERVRVNWRPSKGEEMPPYRGNLKVVSITRKPPRAPDDISNIYDDDAQWAMYRVWDGTYWASGYDPFCTLRCALSFARKAHAAGYTIKRRAV